jgi:hypothetical protein
VLKLLLAPGIAFVALVVAAASFPAGGTSPKALAAPANDDIANATVVELLPHDESVDLGQAIRKPNEPYGTCSRGQITKTVWYKFMPEESGYVSATIVDAPPSASTAIAAYKGADPAQATIVACSNRWSAPQKAALSVIAGQTYYFQVGTFLEDRVIVPTTPPPSPPLPSVGGIAPPSIPVTIHFESFDVPSCATPAFNVTDPTNDPVAIFVRPSPPGSPDAPLDIVSVSGGADDENLCLQINLAASIPAPTHDLAGAVLSVDMDTDGSSSGWSGSGCSGSEMGSDVRIDVEHPANVLVPLEIAFPPRLEDGSYQRWNGYLLTEESSFVFIAPLEALERGETLGLGLALLYGSGMDCAPNAGMILSPHPAELGDANCDRAINSVDSSLILQRSARLLTRPILCEYAGDVDFSNRITAVDAALILQHEAGLLSEF